jgi:hypothetical protein
VAPRAAGTAALVRVDAAATARGRIVLLVRVGHAVRDRVAPAPLAHPPDAAAGPTAVEQLGAIVVSAAGIAPTLIGRRGGAAPDRAAAPGPASRGSALAIARAARRPAPARVVHVQIQIHALVRGSRQTAGRRVVTAMVAVNAAGETVIAAPETLVATLPVARAGVRSRGSRMASVRVAQGPALPTTVAGTGARIRGAAMIVAQRIGVRPAPGAAMMTVPVVARQRADAMIVVRPRLVADMGARIRGAAMIVAQRIGVRPAPGAAMMTVPVVARQRADAMIVVRPRLVADMGARIRAAATIVAQRIGVRPAPGAVMMTVPVVARQRAAIVRRGAMLTPAVRRAVVPAAARETLATSVASVVPVTAPISSARSGSSSRRCRRTSTPANCRGVSGPSSADCPLSWPSRPAHTC